MRIKLLCKTNFLLAIGLLTNVLSQTCDTTINLLGNKLVTCLSSNCPKDSSKVEFENDHLRRKRIYFACNDSGMFLFFNNNGDTLTKSFFKGKSTIGISSEYYSVNHPKRFITYNNNGKKHGWEVTWNENGNTQDSIRYVNGEMVYYRTSYQNGNVRYRVSKFYKEHMKRGNAVFYMMNGTKCGEIKNGNGTYILHSDDAKTRWLETYQNGEEIASRKLEPGENPKLK